MTPPERVRRLNQAPVAGQRQYVLYWMTSARRAHANFALERAAEHARELKLPLVVFEALRVDYPYASDRLHRFVLDGMSDNARAFAATPVLYLPYVEPAVGAGRDLLAALAKRAAIVVGDDCPTSFLPRMRSAAAARLDVCLEVVDSCGLLPLRATDRAFTTAHSFRRFLQKVLPYYLEQTPLSSPLADLPNATQALIPRAITERWPSADPFNLTVLPIDHGVRPIAGTRGGMNAANARLTHFVARQLGNYADRNHPDDDSCSGLSPYLHFGHIASHEIFRAVATHEAWSETRLSDVTLGKRSGWWGMSDAAEGFIDQLVTWRELAFNGCVFIDRPTSLESLPGWAQATLRRHRGDPRPWVYSAADFAAGRTHDRLWNAAQHELREDGRLHNYLRMLWGKMILLWSETPEAALRTMFDLNDRYALDGRDPNSIAGITWCLGRYDRAWGPERKVIGSVRYMTAGATMRKLRVKKYLERHGQRPP